MNIVAKTSMMKEVVVHTPMNVKSNRSTSAMSLSVAKLLIR